jgi:queuine tRNA-ribosyltransferase
MINAGEMLGGMLISLHNITYLNKLMADIRNAILEDRFSEFIEEFYEKTGKTYKRY